MTLYRITPLFSLFATIFMGAMNGSTVHIPDALITQHLSLLHNLVFSRSPLLILLSGTAGMGKTTVAKRLEMELSAVRIALDEGRNLMKEHNVYPAHEQEQIACMGLYLEKLLGALPRVTSNQLLILDDSVDRLYDVIIAAAAHHHYPTFLIQLDVSKETAMRRIKAREQHPEGYLKNIDRWYVDYVLFDPTKINYMLDNDDNTKEPDFGPLLAQLKTKCDLYD